MPFPSQDRPPSEDPMDRIPDLDPQETREWLDALDGVLAAEGPDRAHFLIEQLIDRARRSGAYLPFSANTAYINTIPVDKQVRMPGDQNLENKIRSYVRWNAMAMVVRANSASQRVPQITLITFQPAPRKSLSSS